MPSRSSIWSFNPAKTALIVSLLPQDKYMKKVSAYKTLLTVSALALVILLSSWGNSGHRKINRYASLSFPVSMSAFTVWADSLSAHASDADARKGWDPEEAPRHYIDLENFPMFVAEGRVPLTYDSALALYGTAFLSENGNLPWATRSTFDSLVSAFSAHNWHAAIRYASDLGHYVGDGHMPLHLTANYDGQLSGQDGIHSRYESSMIYYFLSEIWISGVTADTISDISSYIHTYIYHNHSYCDSVLLADSIAHAQAGNTGSYNYYSKLWLHTSGFTKQLFNLASRRLGELIFNAWLRAGSPPFNTTSGWYDDRTDVVVFPNPCRELLALRIEIPGTDSVYAKVTSSDGRHHSMEVVRMHNGSDIFIISTKNLPSGLYFGRLHAGGKSQAFRFVRLP
jgi:hypothetical protein